MPTAQKQPSPSPNPKRRARALAKEVGERLLAEYQAAKQLHDFSKVTQLQIPPDTYKRELAIRRRAYALTRARRFKAVADLKALLKIDF